MSTTLSQTSQKMDARPMELIFLTFKLKSCSIKVKTFVKENIGDRLKIIY